MVVSIVVSVTITMLVAVAEMEMTFIDTATSWNGHHRGRKMLQSPTSCIAVSRCSWGREMLRSTITAPTEVRNL